MDGGDACGTYVTNGRGNSREIFVVRGKFETVDEGPCVVDEEVESIREELHVVWGGVPPKTGCSNFNSHSTAALLARFVHVDDCDDHEDAKRRKGGHRFSGFSLPFE